MLVQTPAPPARRTSSTLSWQQPGSAASCCWPLQWQGAIASATCSSSRTPSSTPGRRLTKHGVSSCKYDAAAVIGALLRLAELSSYVAAVPCFDLLTRAESDVEQLPMPVCCTLVVHEGCELQVAVLHVALSRSCSCCQVHGPAGLAPRVIRWVPAMDHVSCSSCHIARYI